MGRKSWHKCAHVIDEVLICACDRGGDRNCHWHWDAGDLAKAVTGWCVCPLHPRSYSLQHSAKLPKHAHLSFTEPQQCVQHMEFVMFKLIRFFFFSSFVCPRFGKNLIKSMIDECLCSGWWWQVGVITVRHQLKPMWPQPNHQCFPKEAECSWGPLTSYCVSPYGAALLNVD